MDMKYFEFNNNAFSYYGLIGAPDIESAKAAYYEWVSDPEEYDGEPEEISREVAKEKHDLACNRCDESSCFEESEKNCINENDCWLVLLTVN